MAITIGSYPLDSNSVSSIVSEPLFAYEKAVYTVTSDDVSVIRCIADVYINSTHATNGTYKISLEKSPDIGTTNQFTFDISSVIQDYLSAYVPKKSSEVSTHSMVADTDSGSGFVVKFYEVLDNGTTFDTSWLPDGAANNIYSTNSTRRYFYNGGLEHEEEYDLTDFYVNGAFGYLSKGTSTRKIKRGDIAVLSGWRYEASSSVLFKGDYITYTGDTTIATAETSAVGSNSQKFNYFFDTGDVATSIDKVVLRMKSGTANYFTENLTYEIVENCNDYVGLYWQNSVGGIDYYLFRDAQVKTKVGETETYTKPLVNGFNISDFSQTVLNKMGQISISCNSEVINRTDANWLSELFTTANRAWIYNGTNYIPVIIADGSLETINTMDGEYRVRIELLYSNKINGQRY